MCSENVFPKLLRERSKIYTNLNLFINIMGDKLLLNFGAKFQR